MQITFHKFIFEMVKVSQQNGLIDNCCNILYAYNVLYFKIRYVVDSYDIFTM